MSEQSDNFLDMALPPSSMERAAEHVEKHRHREEQRHLESLAATIAAGIIWKIGLDRGSYATAAGRDGLADTSLSIARTIVELNRT